MGVMMLAAECGAKLVLRAEGPDADAGAGRALASSSPTGSESAEWTALWPASPRHPASPSVPVHLLRWEVPEVPHRMIPEDEIPSELRRFHAAIDRAKERLHQVRDAGRGRGRPRGSGDLRRAALDSRRHRTPVGGRGTHPPEARPPRRRSISSCSNGASASRVTRWRCCASASATSRTCTSACCRSSSNCPTTTPWTCQGR